jgi:hypothetical protein
VPTGLKILGGGLTKAQVEALVGSGGITPAEFAAFKAEVAAIDIDATMAANSDERVPSQKATKAYVDALASSINAFVYKGVKDCSGNPNYPAATAGETYVVSVAGKIGGAGGLAVEVGDLLLCNTDGASAGTQAEVGAKWNVLQTRLEPAGLASKAEVSTEQTRAKTAEAANALALELLQRGGLPEKFWPGLTLNGFPLYQASSIIPTAAQVSHVRFVPPRNMTVRGLSLGCLVIATANDPCAIALKAENGTTTLAASGAVEGKLNAAAGRVDIDFTADVALEAGKIYYPSFQYGTVGGTAASLLAAEVRGNSTAMAGMFGSTAPNLFVGTSGPAFPFATSPAPAASGSRVNVFVRER